FVVWSMPVLLTAVLVAIATPHVARGAGLPRPRGMPDWASGRMWRLGLFQSSASMVYFGANTFIPDYLHATGQADLVGLALPALLAGPAEVARLSAGTFAISYSMAFVVTLLAGAVWDATHVEAGAFLPALAGSAIVAVLGPRLVLAAADPRGR